MHRSTAGNLPLVWGVDSTGTPVKRSVPAGAVVSLRGDLEHGFDSRGPTVSRCRDCDDLIFTPTVGEHTLATQRHYASRHGHTPGLLGSRSREPSAKTRVIGGRYTAAISRVINARFRGQAWVITPGSAMEVVVECRTAATQVQEFLSQRGYQATRTVDANTGHIRFHITRQTVT